MGTVAANIDELPLFEDLSLRKKTRLRQIATLHTYRKNEFIYMPGDESDHIHIVSEGRIKIAKVSESGKELTLAFYGPGDLFGELALLNDEPRRTMALSIALSRVWSVVKSEFMEIANTTPQFSFMLSTIIGQRRHDLENRMESLVFKDVPARLAGQLISLAEQYGQDRDGHIHIDLKLSQLELANLIGATRETTSTAINDMKRAGIVDTSHRTIVINDLDALYELKESI